MRGKGNPLHWTVGVLSDSDGAVRRVPQAGESVREKDREEKRREESQGKAVNTTAAGQRKTSVYQTMTRKAEHRYKYI